MPDAPPAVGSIPAGRVRVGPSDIHGTGVFAGAWFEADEVIGRIEGMLTETEGTYVLWISDELGLEVTNDFRFINHAPDPNCILTEFEVIALRDIAPGEELTHDYGGSPPA